MMLVEGIPSIQKGSWRADAPHRATQFPDAVWRQTDPVHPEGPPRLQPCHLRGYVNVSDRYVLKASPRARTRLAALRRQTSDGEAAAGRRALPARGFKGAQRGVGIVWDFEPDEIDRQRGFVAERGGDFFVRSRIDTHVASTPGSVDLDRFWHVLVGCLPSSQQRSGPDS